jgi:16S rRNA (guanine527-N7)-methyltransferase
MIASADLLLRDLSVRVNIPLDAGVRAAILRFFQSLLSWNQRINLTGARDLEQLVGEHLVDSLALVRLVPQGASLVDVGSGGGLPAIPFSLLRPDCKVSLVEPRGKRIAFLRTVVRELALGNISVLHGSDDGLNVQSTFSAACSRATFEPSEWLGRGKRLVVPGGLIVVLTTGEVRTPAFSLVDHVAYQTVAGSPRWAGSYRST